MNVVTITLLIANLVTVAAGATVIKKEIDKTNKQIGEAEARIFAHMRKFTGSIKQDIEGLDEKLDMKEIKVDIKEHISKEFMAMTFRTIKIQDLRKGRES